jgi:hypothetical protein
LHPKSLIAILAHYVNSRGCHTLWQDYGVNFIISLFCVRSMVGNGKQKICICMYYIYFFQFSDEIEYQKAENIQEETNVKLQKTFGNYVL